MNNIHQLYFLEFCRNNNGIDDPNVAYILLEGNTLNVMCYDITAETYLPKEYNGYEVKFTQLV